MQLRDGQTLRITTRDVVDTADLVSSTYAGLPRDVHPGDRVMLDDGLIRLVVTAVESDTVVMHVEEGGPLGEHKGINLRLALWWGAVPIHQPLHPGDILSAERMARHLRQAGVGRQGDRIIAVSVHHGSTDQPIGAVAQQLLSGAQ